MSDGIYSCLYAGYIASTQYTVPVAGQTVVCTPNKNFLMLICDPAGILATMTIQLPDNPRDGDLMSIFSSKVVTLLTITNGTFAIALTALGVGSPVTKAYCASSAKWY